MVPTRLALGLLTGLFALSAPALAADADGDGVPDAADAFPCDAAAAAAVFMPGQGVHGMILVEDQWPSRGDNDFNDLALGYNYAFRLAADGRVLSIRATFNALAVGGVFDNALALHLPIPASEVASVTRALGTNPPEALTPSALDAELTVTVSPNLRELFGGTAGTINSEVAKPVQQGEVLVVDIVLANPARLSFAEAPYDVFVARTDDPTHQIHRPEYAGTAAMDDTLFGTQDDGSTSSRRFVDTLGTPFVLLVPVDVEWPAEAAPIAQLWPDILTFASSGGAQSKDFYVSTVDRAHAFVPAGGLSKPLPRFMGADHAPAATGCIQGWGLAVDFGSSRNLFAYGSAVADNGDAIVAGYVQGSLPGQTSAGGLDLYVARYDGTTGNELWAIQLGGAGDDVGRDVAIDAAGNIYVSGETTSGFLGASRAGQQDALLVALAADGSVRWSQQLGGAGSETAYGVAVDPTSGEVVVAGGTTSPSLPGHAGTGAALGTFLARYDAAGQRIWTQVVRMDASDPTNYDYALDVAIDETSGDIVVVGAERRYGQSASAAENQFAAQLSSQGLLQWVTHIGGYGYSKGAADQRYGFAHGVTLDHLGAVYVTGYWYGGTSNASWGDWSRASGDVSADATLTKVDAAGQVQWSYALASAAAGDDRGEAVAYSPQTGLVFFTGRTSSALPGQTSKGGDDFYLAAYDRSGVEQWLVQDGTAAHDVGFAAATAAELLSVVADQQVQGSVFVVGNTTGALGGPDAGHWEITIRAYDLQTAALQDAVIGSQLSWTSGAWSGCNTTCGTGAESRSVACVRADGVTVADSACVQSKPASSRACTVTSGCSYAWQTSAWGTCSAACGASSQTRSVSCVRSDGATVSDDQCVSAGMGARPSSSQSCTDHSTCTYSWYTGSWSACGGASCGTGSQSRTVYCRRSDGTQVSSGLCAGSAPSSSQSCDLGACNTGCVRLGQDVRTLTRPPSDYTLPNCSAPGGAVCERSGTIPSGWRLATQAEGQFLSPLVGFGTCAVWTNGCWYWTRSGNVLTCNHTVSGCHSGGCAVSGGFCYTAALLIREGMTGTCTR